MRVMLQAPTLVAALLRASVSRPASAVRRALQPARRLQWRQPLQSQRLPALRSFSVTALPLRQGSPSRAASSRAKAPASAMPLRRALLAGLRSRLPLEAA